LSHRFTQLALDSIANDCAAQTPAGDDGDTGWISRRGHARLHDDHEQVMRPRVARLAHALEFAAGTQSPYAHRSQKPGSFKGARVLSSINSLSN
jgi:hypothetical protein